MNYSDSDLIAQDAMVQELLRPLVRFFAVPHVTEIVVNRPGEVFVESAATWSRHEAPELTLVRCRSLATAIASYAGAIVDSERPLLTAQLPGGARIQVIVPPACERETVSMTIRIAGSQTRTFEDYESAGFFSQFRWTAPPTLARRRGVLTPVQNILVDHLLNRRLGKFLSACVLHRQNIVFVGDTGCGKTSLMKSACQYIPEHERLVSIEDVRELELPSHPNRVHMLYSRTSPINSGATTADLIACAMRMKPDRVLLAELRGAEAFDYLKLLTTGHSGSISSFHAESCALAQERYVLMCKEHPQAAAYEADALRFLVSLTLDVIVHIAVARVEGEGGKFHKQRFISEVRYDPIAKLGSRLGSATVNRWDALP
jgi:type IV secretion system protein VirB11